MDKNYQNQNEFYGNQEDFLNLEIQEQAEEIIDYLAPENVEEAKCISSEYVDEAERLEPEHADEAEYHAPEYVEEAGHPEPDFVSAAECLGPEHDAGIEYLVSEQVEEIEYPEQDFVGETEYLEAEHDAEIEYLAPEYVDEVEYLKPDFVGETEYLEPEHGVGVEYLAPEHIDEVEYLEPEFAGEAEYLAQEHVGEAEYLEPEYVEAVEYFEPVDGVEFNTFGIAALNAVNRTVIFNANGGSINPPFASTRTVLNGSAIGILPTATRAGHTFAGWWTTQTGGMLINSSRIITANATFRARWNQQVVNRTVTFNANGGTPNPASRTVPNNQTLGSLPIVNRTGFVFAGWWTAVSGGSQVFANTAITANLNLVARWNQQIVQRTVTFNANGGTVSPTTRNVNNGAVVGALPNPTRPGFNFVGWFNTSAATGGTQTTANTVINANVTFWARWTPVVRLVTFNANGGSVSPTSRNVNNGAVVGALPNPTRVGFNFVGWFNTSAATGGTQTTANTVINANVTFWARWTPIVRVVTFNPNGGSVSPTTRNVNNGAAVGALPNPTRPGFNFVGWFNTNAATGGTQFTQNSIINANTTMWARWQTPVVRVVTFNANGGTVSPTTRNVNSGTAVGTLPIPTRAGFNFVGWFNTNAATGGTQTTANTIINVNVLFWARWTPIVRVVTFNANGGSVSPTTRNINNGASVGTLPTPTRAGFTFVGWFNTSAATGGTQFTQNSIINANTTMWARWQTPIVRVVTFNANGGSVSPTTRNVNSGAVVGALPTPTRAGFTFVGWFNTNAATGGTQTTANTIINANVTFWARWTPNWTLTFCNNGAIVAIRTVANNQSLPVSQIPIPPAGANWYINPNLTVRFSDQVVVRSDLNIEAVNGGSGDSRFPVTFNAHPGSFRNPEDIAVSTHIIRIERGMNLGMHLNSLPIPSRAGHIFDGWLTAANIRISEATIPFPIGTSHQAVTYLARWTSVHLQKILIDAGHFGNWNVVTHTHNGETFTYIESVRMWQLQEFLVQELRNLGFVNAQRLRNNIDQQITGPQDDNFNRGLRAEGFDLFIQLHSDAADDSSIDHAVIYYPMDGRNNTRSLGEAFGSAIRTTMRLNGNSRIATRTNAQGDEHFAVMRGARAVNCPRYFITENSFHTNPRAAHWLMQNANLQQLARAYADVIRSLFS